jgi:curved DNA-binding protein CbpA
MSSGESTNYYEILEIKIDAPSHEVHKAYQRAKTTYSDGNPALYTMFTEDEARELLRLVEEAYSVLGNSTTRRNYDEALARGENPTQAPAPDLLNAKLPDLELKSETKKMSTTAPEMVHTTSSTSPSASSANAPPPPGSGRTQLSTFKIDETFEKELAGTSDFDGQMLQRTRLYKNISIDKMSESTRISRSYLMAVETNNYANLPAAVFVRGFVVQMARLLGLDENKTAASYMKRFKAGGGK